MVIYENCTYFMVMIYLMIKIDSRPKLRNSISYDFGESHPLE